MIHKNRKQQTSHRRVLRSSLSVTFFTLALLIILNSCKPTEIIQEPPPPRPAKKLTIFLVDRSGSFHRIQREGHFRGKDYFEIACDQVKDYVKLKADKHNELILVKTIESASFTDDTFIGKLDFTQYEKFEEPEPKGALSNIEKEEWMKRKQKFENDTQDRQAHDIETFGKNLDALRKRAYSDETDIVNATKALIPHLREFATYAKHIVIYSDFKDTQTELESAGQVDLGPDTEVEGRFVSMNEQNPDSYNRLLEQWRTILKCRSIRFKTPAESK